uniref:tRNA pseudouridine(55) synthase n=1 Tax=Trypanosoma congolense (strain IL3000) TaxID=1068625 RepID=G0V0X1_TRYCI|nr:unnamed protein product [Trypanosoma congolense IL3000]
MEGKNALCYACALRMSIMHQVPPPQPPVRPPTTKNAEKVHDSDGRFVDESYHPHFSIVYETPESALRFFGRAQGRVNNKNAPHELDLLCCACLGLYQFLDGVHAPAVAAAIRTSPFIDSTQVSINVNVSRSISFWWLAVSTVFYGTKGREGARPSPSSIIPEEHVSFKDFFMSDLRARVLRYVNRVHSEVLEAMVPAGHKAYLEEITRHTEDSGQVKQTLASQAFVYCPECQGVIVHVNAEHPKLKELASGTTVPPQYCSSRSENVLSYSVIYDCVFPHLKEIGAWTVKPDNTSGADAFLLHEPAALSCVLKHSNIMLIGNYRKVRRNLSQSPWFANGNRVGSFSLQEVIANPILPFFFPEGVTSVPYEEPFKETAPHGVKRPKQEKSQHPGPQKDNPHRTASEEVFGYGRYKFHSAGREDVDVRMLGTGRPFVLELISPSRECVTAQDLLLLEEAVNKSEGGSVEISDLRVTDANVLLRLAHHSQSKVKKYRCVIWCSRAITKPEEDEHFKRVNTVRDLQIHQRTPVRVLHRRSLHERDRVVHSIQLTPLNAHWFLMDLETQAGTYVKEFVHGDMGRTVPHLGQLLNGRTDILQLDVLGMTVEGL